MKVSVLKPGYLVSLKTTVKGGVAYQRVDLEADHLDVTGAQVARWETRREIADPEEFKRATEARGKARSLITGVCSSSSFGLLCPLAREGELSDAITEALRIAADYNADAAASRVEVYVILGQVAQDDVQAARAIAAEVRELLDSMQQGIAAADPEAIRESANKARNLGSMLSPEVAGKVTDAIAQARKAAREIVKRVEKDGERAADVVAECKTDAIAKARFAFLDLDEGHVDEAAAPIGRSLDLDPLAEAMGIIPPAGVQASPSIELA